MKSFVELTRTLLSQDDGHDLYFLSERVSQDPLENYFGKQRSRGRRSENVTIKEAIQNAVAIRAQKSLELDRVQGNCRRKKRICPDALKVTAEDETPLPKHKRRKCS